MCTNAVNLEANFREGSVLLQNDSLVKINPSLLKCIPVGDGVKNYVQYVSSFVHFCRLHMDFYRSPYKLEILGNIHHLS